MKVTETKIPDLLILEPDVFNDDRGWFIESFNQKKFEKVLLDREFIVPEFVQDNHSLSAKGVLRGLHYQLKPHAQGKLVRVVQGRAWDVAVDIRQNSATFGQWVGVELTAENKKMFWIPVGFAHGFLAMEDSTQLLYKTTDYYRVECEQNIVWNDVDLDIQWPIESGMELILSDKDQAAPTLQDLINKGKNIF